MHGTPAEPTARLGVRGLKAGAFIEYPKDSTQLTIAPNYIYVVISQKYATNHFEVQQIINQLMVHDHRFRTPAQVHAYSIK